MEANPQTQPEVQAQPEAPADPVELEVGAVVEVLTLENRLTFVGRVEQYRKGVVTIRESSGQELPPVIYNKEIKLRCFHRNGTQVIHGKICGNTQWIWKLDRLEKKFSMENRLSFRQNVLLKSPAACYRQSDPARHTSPCQILDVSAGGLLFSSRELYQEGEALVIAGARIVEEVEPFDFRCKVRRVGDPKQDRRYSYGCQFQTLPPKEEERLLRAIFIAQRKEIQAQRARGG